jgi:hypothetical protein
MLRFMGAAYHDKTESGGRLANEDCRGNEFMLL